MITAILHIGFFHGSTSGEALNNCIQSMASNYGYSLVSLNDSLALDVGDTLEIDLSDGFNLPLSSFAYDNSEFETDLYSELLNNEETVSNLNTYINGGDVSMITDRDLAFQKNIELYNANVLALRATKNVNANVSGSISQSGEQSDLSGVENKLQNISTSLNNIKDNLQYTDTDDITKGLAQIESEKTDTKSIVVETVEKAPFNPYLDKDNNDIYGV